MGGASLNGSSTVAFNASTINGVAPLTAEQTASATNLGSMAAQNADSVAITGGVASLTSITLTDRVDAVNANFTGKVDASIFNSPASGVDTMLGAVQSYYTGATDISGVATFAKILVPNQSLTYQTTGAIIDFYVQYATYEIAPGRVAMSQAHVRANVTRFNRPPGLNSAVSLELIGTSSIVDTGSGVQRQLTAGNFSYSIVDGTATESQIIEFYFTPPVPLDSGATITTTGEMRALTTRSTSGFVTFQDL